MICQDLAGQDVTALRSVTFLESASRAVHNPSPPWQEFEDIQIDPLRADVWVEIAVRFSHPVKTLRREAISVSSGATLAEVARSI